MAGWSRFLFSCWLVGLGACGGNATNAGVDGTGGTPAATGGNAGLGNGGSAGQGGRAKGGAASLGGTGSGGTPFIDPMCPTVDPPPALVECDPLASVNECGPGFGCYPYVQHPFGDGCDAETYGALCLPVGSGTQGALCGEGTDDCAAGYICVIGAHAGKRCAKLCGFNGGNECPLGMICGDTDIQGYGVCD